MSRIGIEFLDQEVREMFATAMRALGGDLTPVMKNIGEYVTNETQDRFKNEKDPDGNSWQPLKPSTLARKKNPKILQEQGGKGGLLGSINYRAAKTQVTIGTNKPYAAIHQFGGKTSAHIIRPKKGKALKWIGADGMAFFAKEVRHPGSKIPARPFLGVNASDEQEIFTILQDWMKLKGF